MKRTIYTMWKRCEEKYAALPAVRWLVKKDVKERSYGELAADVKAIRKGFVAQDFSHKHIVLIGLIVASIAVTAALRLNWSVAVLLVFGSYIVENLIIACISLYRRR